MGGCCLSLTLQFGVSLPSGSKFTLGPERVRSVRNEPDRRRPGRICYTFPTTARWSTPPETTRQCKEWASRINDLPHWGSAAGHREKAMEMQRLLFQVGLVCLLATSTPAGFSAHAQDYPAGPVKFITQLAAGGGTDPAMRIVIDHLAGCGVSKPR